MSSIVGLEMPNAWRTGQFNDSNFDISADQLNVTTNREMWVPSGTINWDTTLHKNALDPVDTQDLATKNYVDINGGALWSTFPATQAVDMATFQINDLGDPTLDQDAATKIYVDTNAGAQELDELSDVTIDTPLDQQFLRYNSGSGQWENVAFTPGAGPAIEAGNSSVTVIDTGVGRVETVIDGTLRTSINATLFDIGVPISMNSQQINDLGTPASDSDATTKVYVDDAIAAIPVKTDLDSLDDVTITTPLVNQVLVNDGLGQWINQAITKTQLPTSIAYEDETNSFTLQQTFEAGWIFGSPQDGNLNGGTLSQILSTTFTEQSVDPSDPLLTEAKIFLDDGADFNSPDPILEILIDRGGQIEKKPIVTSETVFALRNFSNGMFTQETGTRILTDGGIGILVQIFNENDFQGTFEVVLDGQVWVIEDPDVSPSVSNSISLSVGTDVAPTKHWVWIEISGGVPTMTSSSVEFPSTGDFAVVGTFLLESQATVLADGAYAVNSPDYEIFDEASRGHLAHINDNLITKDALYISGIALTTVPAIGASDSNVTFTSTAGVAMELHREDIESFDITTGIALVENEGTQTSLEVTRVDDIGLDLVGLTCANGTTVIGNNDRINVVIYTIHNDDEPNQTNYGINLPFDVYGNDQDAIDDVSGFAIKTVPLNLRGVALLVAEVVISISNLAATFEVLTVKDLRGQIPGAAGGTGGGAGGVSQLNDLSDVTIVTPLIDQVLVNDGAGQWVNVVNPAGILADANTWENYQDWKAIADPGASVSASEARFFSEVIDANTTGLFCYLQRNGAQTKVRLA